MLNSKIVALAVGAALLGSATVAFAYPGQQLAGQAHVSLARARALAVQTAPGTIVSQELEKEAGGSGLRFTFDIKTASGVREVGVDAKTGAVLENSADSASEAGENGESGGTGEAGGETSEAGG